MTCIVIVDWDEHYEINRTRELKVMKWLPIPNKMDGSGYTSLVDHPDSAAHFGVWCALLEIASRCPRRGILTKSDGRPLDSNDLSRISRFPVNLWNEVLPRLVSIGWITNNEIPQEGATMSQEGAGIPHDAAESVAVDPALPRKKAPYITLQDRTEQKGEKSKSPPSLAPPSSQEKTGGVYKKVDDLTLEDPMIIELMEIHRRATNGVDLVIKPEDMPALLELFRRHDGKSIVAAYRLHQEKKPGKEFHYFLADFAEYFAKAQKPGKIAEATCSECHASRGAHTASCSKHPDAIAESTPKQPPPDNFEDDFPEAAS